MTNDRIETLAYIINELNQYKIPYKAVAYDRGTCDGMELIVSFKYNKDDCRVIFSPMQDINVQVYIEIPKYSGKARTITKIQCAQTIVVLSGLLISFAKCADDLDNIAEFVENCNRTSVYKK